MTSDHAVNVAEADRPGGEGLAQEDLTTELAEWLVDGSWVGSGLTNDRAQGSTWFNWPALMRTCLMTGMLSKDEADEVRWRRVEK